MSQGGRDVPDEKLLARFERTQANLKRAIDRLPYVIVYSNDDIADPYKLVGLYELGKSTMNSKADRLEANPTCLTSVVL